jgi:translation initiation factor 3 subunit C
LVSLEASINTAVAKEKEAKKKMNAANFRALSGAKQKVKKAQKEFEAPLKQYQEVSRLSF